MPNMLNQFLATTSMERTSIPTLHKGKKVIPTVVEEYSTEEEDERDRIEQKKRFADYKKQESEVDKYLPRWAIMERPDFETRKVLAAKAARQGQRRAYKRLPPEEKTKLREARRSRPLPIPDE